MAATGESGLIDAYPQRVPEKRCDICAPAVACKLIKDLENLTLGSGPRVPGDGVGSLRQAQVAAGGNSQRGLLGGGFEASMTNQDICSLEVTVGEILGQGCGGRP
ncbi:hypothetical protein [Nocardia farcinica]|uniref:hypothetical protein n=1 Tax=Nocardia farcinica TaxID=37329 RepID=UPI0024564A23|nr:hypothetical protein [Nocardia farcinica]